MTSNRAEMHVCHHCGKTAMRSTTVRSGKCSMQHKCPHGIWCSGGHPTQCTNNRSHSCKACCTAMNEATASDASRRREELRLFATRNPYTDMRPWNDPKDNT